MLTEIRQDDKLKCGSMFVIPHDDAATMKRSRQDGDELTTDSSLETLTRIQGIERSAWRLCMRPRWVPHSPPT